MRAPDFFEEAFFDPDFLEADFLEADFLAPDFLDADFFEGTFAPFFRASERPMAMACLREVTFLPLRPLRRVPSLRSCMASFTFSPAFFEYFAIVGNLWVIDTGKTQKTRTIQTRIKLPGGSGTIFSKFSV